MKRSTPNWLEFQALVGRIEAAVAPIGAVVKSPDRIRSLVTGRLREVDASITAKVGTAEVLVTVECRQHKSPQNVTWIEQLAAKKQAIGAARTIAVSNGGFSSQAMSMAKSCGIDLRIMKDVLEEEILSWLRVTSIVHVFRHCEGMQVEFQFHRDLTDPEDIEVHATVAEALRDDFANAAIIYNQSGEPLSVNALWLIVQAQGNPYEGLVPGGEPERRLIRVPVPKRDLSLLTTEGFRDLGAVVFTGLLSLRVEEIPLSEAVKVQYQDEESGEVQHRVEFVTRAPGVLNLRVGVQGQGGADAIVLDVEALGRTVPKDGT